MTVDTLSKFLDKLILSMLSYPDLHATSPEQLEAVFYVLDGIKDFVAFGDEELHQPVSSYARYLHENGFNGSMYVSSDSVPCKRSEFDGLVGFLRQYLAESDRLKEGGADEDRRDDCAAQ